jgi:acetyltransferase-like isoleucine patch superfamily enzyme|tara:strand:- start:2765 stop:3322 length:558 start_codon:yes stop_codon:yes gene_type:complete
MSFLKNIVVFITKIISRVFYPKFGLQIIKYWGFQGSWWILNSLWFQKVLGFNRFAPYPTSFSFRISNYNNLVIPISSMNNLQATGVYFQNFSAKIILGENVYIAPNVGIITANHDLKNLKNHKEGKDVYIADNCWIGMNTVVMPGVKLGKNTIVGSGSVVTKSFEDGGVVIAGTPAIIIKKIYND